MKRLVLPILAILLSTTTYSQKIAKKNFSRWSLSVEGGLNRFDGDISQNEKQIFPTSFTETTFGGTIEYALTPIWGLMSEYYYYPLSGKGSIGNFNTKLHTISMSTTVNLSRLITPETTTKLCVYTSLGLGVASYISNLTQPPAALKKSPTCFAGSIPFAISLEYNFSKTFALISKINYRAFTKDNLDGVPYKGVTNDAVASFSLGLRTKFNAVKRSHLRNISVEEYTPNKELLLGLENARRIGRLDTALNKLEKKVNKVAQHVDSLDLVLSNEGPDSDNDGVPDHRDLSPHTPSNTLVDFWGRPANFTINNQTTNNYYFNEIPSVYFGFDQVSLTEEALITISKIAQELIDNPRIRIEVRGYTDHAGSNPYNEKLSQKRADRVKAELVNIWHIDPKRIISNGKGKVIEPQIKYYPSRRCDFFFDK